VKVLAVAIIIFSQQLNSQSIETYLQIAAKNNPDIASAYTKFEAALQKLPQVNALPDPNLSMSVFGKMVETRVGRQEAKFTLSQMFPWFGTLQAKENVANAMAEANFQNYLDVRNEVFFNVKKVYAELFEIHRMLNLEEENLKILDTYKELALSKFKSGKGLMVDVIRIDIKRNESLTNIKLLNDKLTPFQTAFNKLLNRTIDENIVLNDQLPITNLNTEVTTDSLLLNNPKLLGLDKQIAAFENQVIVAKKEGLPKFGLGIDYSIISKRDVPDLALNGQDVLMPMISVSLPIFRKKYNAAQQEAQLMVNATTEKKEAVMNNLQTMLASAKFDASKSNDLLNLYSEQIKRTKQAIVLLVTSYSSSGADFVEILRMNQELLVFEKATATEIKNQYTAIAKLDYLLSKID
jgi:outer membrane protein TolC